MPVYDKFLAITARINELTQYINNPAFYQIHPLTLQQMHMEREALYPQAKFYADAHAHLQSIFERCSLPAIPANINTAKLRLIEINNTDDAVTNKTEKLRQFFVTGRELMFMNLMLRLQDVEFFDQEYAAAHFAACEELLAHVMHVNPNDILSPSDSHAFKTFAYVALFIPEYELIGYCMKADLRFSWDARFAQYIADAEIKDIKRAEMIRKLTTKLATSPTPPPVPSVLQATAEDTAQAEAKVVAAKEAEAETKAAQQKLAAEEAAREEQERVAAEEAAKAEAEREAAEAVAKAEATAKLIAEEKTRKDAERAEAKRREKEKAALAKQQKAAAKAARERLAAEARAKAEAERLAAEQAAAEAAKIERERLAAEKAAKEEAERLAAEAAAQLAAVEAAKKAEEAKSPIDKFKSAIAKMDYATCDKLMLEKAVSDEEICTCILKHTPSEPTKPGRKKTAAQQPVFDLKKLLRLSIRVCCMLLTDTNCKAQFKEALFQKLTQFSTDEFAKYDKIFDFVSMLEDYYLESDSHGDKPLVRTMTAKRTKCKSEVKDSTSLHQALILTPNDKFILTKVCREYIDKIRDPHAKRDKPTLIRHLKDQNGDNPFHVLFSSSTKEQVLAILEILFEIDTDYQLSTALFSKNNLGITPLLAVEQKEEDWSEVTEKLHARVYKMVERELSSSPEKFPTHFLVENDDIFNNKASNNLIIQLHAAAQTTKDYTKLHDTIRARCELRSAITNLIVLKIGKIKEKPTVAGILLSQDCNNLVSNILGDNEFFTLRIDGTKLLNHLFNAIGINISHGITNDSLSAIASSEAFKFAAHVCPLADSHPWIKVTKCILDGADKTRFELAINTVSSYIKTYKTDVHLATHDSRTILSDAINMQHLQCVLYASEELGIKPSENDIYLAVFSYDQSIPDSVEILKHIAKLCKDDPKIQNVLLDCAICLGKLDIVKILHEEFLMPITVNNLFDGISQENTELFLYLVTAYIRSQGTTGKPINELKDANGKDLLYHACIITPNPQNLALLLQHGFSMAKTYNGTDDVIPFVLIQQTFLKMIPMPMTLELINIMLSDEATRKIIVKLKNPSNYGVFQLLVTCSNRISNATEQEAFLAVLLTLVKSGAVLTDKDLHKDNIIHYVAHNDRPWLVKFILDLVQEREPEKFPLLMNEGNADHFTPLDTAVINSLQNAPFQTESKIDLLTPADLATITLAVTPGHDKDSPLIALFKQKGGKQHILGQILSKWHTVIQRVSRGNMTFEHKVDSDGNNVLHLICKDYDAKTAKAALETLFTLDTEHAFSCAIFNKNNHGKSVLVMCEEKSAEWDEVTDLLHERIIALISFTLKKPYKQWLKLYIVDVRDVFNNSQRQNIISDLWEAGSYNKLASIVYKRGNLCLKINDVLRAAVAEHVITITADFNAIALQFSNNLETMFGKNEYLSVVIYTGDEGSLLVDRILCADMQSGSMTQDLQAITTCPVFITAVQEFPIVASTLWQHTLFYMQDIVQEPLLKAHLLNFKHVVEKYAIDINAVSESLRTPLIDSIAHGSFLAVKFLCQTIAGLRAEISDEAMACAILQFTPQDPQILNYLATSYYSQLEKSDVTDQDLLFSLALTLPNLAAVKFLYNKFSIKILPKMVFAAIANFKRNNMQCLEFALVRFKEQGGSLSEIRNEDGMDPLYLTGLYNPNDEKFFLLLDHGCSFAHRYGVTQAPVPILLLIAAYEGHLSIPVASTRLQGCLQRCVSNPAIKHMIISARDNHNFGILEHVIECCKVAKTTEDHEAIRVLIVTLLQLGVPLTETLKHKDNIFHILAQCPSITVVRLVVAELKKLEQWPALFKAENDNHETPLAVIRYVHSKSPKVHGAVLGFFNDLNALHTKKFLPAFEGKSSDKVEVLPPTTALATEHRPTSSGSGLSFTAS